MSYNLILYRQYYKYIRQIQRGGAINVSTTTTSATATTTQTGIGRVKILLRQRQRQQRLYSYYSYNNNNINNYNNNNINNNSKCTYGYNLLHNNVLQPVQFINSTIFSSVPSSSSSSSCYSRNISNTRLVQLSDSSNSSTNSSTSTNSTTKSSSNSNTIEYVSIITHPELVNEIPLQDIRNFCFIAHVDHGKSSLSMRVLELTGNLGIELQKDAWKAVLEQESITDNINSSSSSSSSSSSTSSPSGSPSTTTSTTKDHSSSKSSSKDATSNSKEQIDVLDRLAVEQQRGITVKTTTATMLYKHSSAVGPTGYLLLNMYDTPGHVDFGKEVTRTLQFVQGAVLLLDSTQGIQAQTWSVYEKAIALPIPPTIIMSLTKIDMEASRPIHVSLTVSEFFNIDDPDTIIHTSARNRIGIKCIVDAVCQQVPAPTALPDDEYVDEYPLVPIDTKNYPLRAQVIDSWFDSRGVNCLVRIVSGILQEGDRISIVLPNATAGKTDSATTITTSTTTIVDTSEQEKVVEEQKQQQQDQSSYPVQEVGILLPKAHRTNKLRRGQMGYVRFGLRDPRQAMPGTVLVYNTHINNKNLILPHIPAQNLITKSVLYASVHPYEVDEFEDLCNAIDRLALNDTGLEVSKTSAIGAEKSDGPFLGPGLRVGFQGLLHVEVFRQRLSDEFNIDAVVTPPKVPYTIIIEPNRNNTLKEPVTTIVEDLSDWPEPGTKCKVFEPIVDARIIARVEDAGAVMDLINRKRGYEIQTKPIDEEKWVFTAKIPWAEVVTDFHDQLKTVTSGFGSLDTTESDPPFVEANLCKVDMMLNGESVTSLSFVCHKDAAHGEGRSVCKKLQEVLPRQQFVTVIQAKADGKIVAAERIKAFRKDVLTKSGKTVGGGDQSRKMKLLEKQKKGKKRMQDSGRVTLSQAAFNSVISRST